MGLFVVTVAESESVDLQLMRFVADGDERAKRVVARRLVGHIRQLAAVLMAGDPEADDAAQLALMEILRSAKSYRGEGTLERWANRIAVRVILRHAKRQRERRNRIEAVTRQRARTGTLQPPSEAAAVRDLLGRLSDERQRVLVLKYGLGYTVREIAELTDSPEGTVKDRLWMGKKQLRELFQAEGIDARTTRQGGARQ